MKPFTNLPDALAWANKRGFYYLSPGLPSSYTGDDELSDKQVLAAINGMRFNLGAYRFSRGDK